MARVRAVPGTRHLAHNDVLRLARQGLMADISSAIERYEKRLYGERVGRVTHEHVGSLVQDVTRTLVNGSKTDIDTMDEIAAILPPEAPAKRKGRPRKTSGVSSHIRGEDLGDPPGIPAPPPNAYGLGRSEERVLALIAQSPRGEGLTPAQIAIQVALKKRSILNVLTALKSRLFIVKAEGNKFRATEEGRAAVRGRCVPQEKGAILARLSESERRILFAIGSKDAGITSSALAVLVPGLAKRSRLNICTKLKTRELIEKQGDRFVLTAHAREELEGKLDKPLTGKALRVQVRESLSGPQVIVFDYLCDAGEPTPDQIATGLGYSPRTVRNILSELKALELVTKCSGVLAGRFQLSPDLAV